MATSTPRKAPTSAKPIETRTNGIPDWRTEALARLLRLIREALPDAVEEVKWRKPSKPAGVPVWYQDGIMFHVEAFKNDVRLTFLKGASLKDPNGLFDPRIGRNAMRAVLLREGDVIDGDGIKSLLRAAAALNASTVHSSRRKPGT
jgi:hypothetical protein